MSSLQALRDLLRQKKQELDSDDQPDTDTQGTTNTDVTDQATWMSKIADTGNQAQDWLEFTNYMKNAVTYGNQDIYTSYILNLYNKAIKAISADQHKDSAAYALLLINFADFQSETSVEDARGILHHARISVKRQSIVHIMSAEFEIKHGNRYKAKRLLEKAESLGSKPADLLTKAMTRLSSGEQELLSEDDRANLTDILLPKENAANVNNPAGSKTGLMSRALCEISNMPLQSSNTSTSKLPEKSVKPSETPQIYTDILKPKLTGTLSEDSPVSFKPTEEHSHNITWDRADTLPLSTDDPPTSRSLRSYHSTPDCKNPGMLHINLKPRKVGKPMRVKRSSLPQLREGCSDQSDDTDMFKLEPLMETAVLDDMMQGEPRKSPDGNMEPPSASGEPHQRPMRVPQVISTVSKGGDVVKDVVTASRHRNLSGSLSDSNLLKSFPMSRHHSEPDVSGETSDSTQDSGISSRGHKYSQNLTEEMCPDLPQIMSGDQSTLECRPTGSTATASTLKGSNISHMSTSTALAFLPTSTVGTTQSNMPGKSQAVVPFMPPTSEGQGSSSVTQSKSSSSGVPQSAQPGLPQPEIPQLGLPQPEIQKSGLPQPGLLQPEIPKTGLPQSGIPQFGIPQLGIPQHSMSNSASLQAQVVSAPVAPSQAGMVPAHQGFSQPGNPHHFMPPAMCNPTPNRQTQALTVNNQMYTVLKVLGRGGSSKVYDTLDANFNLRAVKCVNLDCADDATINSYKNEIKLLERLQKSNKVIKLYDFEYQEETNMLYVVMERGDTDLASLFRKESKGEGIDSIMQKFYWKEMLKAVQVLHEEGIVHSDLKPANFVFVAGRLKLIDFGIANVIHQDMTSVTRDQQVGTLNYMSPEAIQDTCGGMQLDENGRVKPKIKIGVKSDVWSLGCILYNLVYGRTPFHHITNSMMKLHAITDPRFQIEFPETADPALRQVLMKCLERDPRQRPSIEELLSYQY